MAAVDDLCQSYLDLKYHFDPAAASAAGLVSHDSPRPFDEETVRAHLRPALGRRRGRGAGERRPAGGDRSHCPARRDPQRDLPLEHERPTCAIRPTGCRTSSRGSTRCSRGGTERGGARAGRARAAPRRTRLPRRGARHARRAALRLRGHVARDAGWRWRAGGAAGRGARARRCPSCAPISSPPRARRSRRSSASARAPGRDRARADPHAFAWARSSSAAASTTSTR